MADSCFSLAVVEVTRSTRIVQLSEPSRDENLVRFAADCVGLP